MKIGIIGAGNIGSALALRFTELGHEVSVANSRGPETLGEIEKQTGATAVTVNDAARGKDVVVVTIPERNVPALPDDLFQGVPDDVVVSRRSTTSRPSICVTTAARLAVRGGSRFQSRATIRRRRRPSWDWSMNSDSIR